MDAFGFVILVAILKALLLFYLLYQVSAKRKQFNVPVRTIPEDPIVLILLLTVVSC